METLLEQANLVAFQSDKLRDMIRELPEEEIEDGGDDGDGGDEGIDETDRQPGKLITLWSADSLGLTSSLIADRRRKAKRNRYRWNSLEIIDDKHEGQVLQHVKRKGDIIFPLGYAQREVTITGAESVHWRYRYNPLVNCGRPGKHMTCSLNGGYRGRGYTSHGWVKLGGSANLMHPDKGSENGLRLFIGHRGVENKFGESYGPGTPILKENRWYDIEVVAHLLEHRWELLLDGERIVLTPQLPHLLFDNDQFEKAHNYIRFMHGGKSEQLPQQWHAEERWGRVSISARWPKN